MMGIYNLIWVIFFAAIPCSTHAYVGPGIGLSAIGSIVAFMGAIFLLFVGFLWYPIKRLFKGKLFDSFRKMGCEVCQEDIEPESSVEESRET